MCEVVIGSHTLRVLSYALRRISRPGRLGIAVRPGRLGLGMDRYVPPAVGTALSAGSAADSIGSFTVSACVGNGGLAGLAEDRWSRPGSSPPAECGRGAGRPGGRHDDADALSVLRRSIPGHAPACCATLAKRGRPREGRKLLPHEARLLSADLRDYGAGSRIAGIGCVTPVRLHYHHAGGVPGDGRPGLGDRTGDDNRHAGRQGPRWRGCAVTGICGPVLAAGCLCWLVLEPLEAGGRGPLIKQQPGRRQRPEWFVRLSLIPALAGHRSRTGRPGLRDGGQAAVPASLVSSARPAVAPPFTPVCAGPRCRWSGWCT
jgi:hypothetical protein